MKTSPLKRLATICLLMGGISGAALTSAQAQNNPRITVNEDGTGNLSFPGGGTFVTTGVMALDPGPGGLSSALTYSLLGPPGLVAGDLIIGDGVPSTSDVVRFNPAGTGGNPGYTASLVFYSFPGEGALADVGFPSALYANTSFVLEGAGDITVYTPTANQPGFVPGFSVTYVIDSSLPETGSALALLAIGCIGIAGFRRFSNESGSFPA